MRIALAVEGTRGDVHPMLSLGNAFQQDGHEVVLCGPANFREDADGCGIEFREIGSDTRAFLDRVAASITSRGFASNLAQLEYFAESIETQFARLPEATADADLILAAGVQLAASSVAELHGIPYRYIVYCPALLPSVDHAPPFVPSQAFPRWANRLGWWLTLGPIDALLRLSLNRRRKKLGLSNVKSAYHNVLSEHPILATEQELAPIPALSSVPTQQLRCLHDHDTGPLPEKLEDFLSQGRPPVYIGFGSMTDPNPEATTRLVLEAIEDSCCRAILSEGWAGIGRGALPEGVIQIGPVSHASLFPHCSAVVHHGGAGTTTRVAQAGVPQIIIPHLLDQYWWGKRIAELGLAPPPMPRASLTVKQLSQALRSVADNEILSERARDMGCLIAPEDRPRSAASAIVAAHRCGIGAAPGGLR